ncbi:protein serine/threonine phosphatase 2C [Acaromyces ingoldii]|uniref:Protein serine/threonine phosphatase 2C n=1 Tax=Acaromyces ingoldii TaxID=215250 RepID=A0A316YFQ4_9BASI|nr:protein serine/threonine phosphatase 2C [Acaromyces ingoldii]PWN86575.1 protein serine/threonine phosphatase 2C [Acaromyces ingoldii]
MGPSRRLLVLAGHGVSSSPSSSSTRLAASFVSARRSVTTKGGSGSTSQTVASSSTASSSAAGAGTGAGAGGAAGVGTAASGGRRPPNDRQRARREWFFVGASGSVAAIGAYWYWLRPDKKSPSSSAQRYFSSAHRTTFSIPVRQIDRATGTMSVGSKIITSLTADEVDQRLTEHEVSTRVEGSAGPCIVTRYDTNSVASNEPIEDKRAEVIVERDNQQGPRGNLSFFAIMDGHAGYHTSTLLSQKLIAFVALELEKVIREAGEYGQIARAKAAMPSKLWRILFGGPESSSSSSSSSSGSVNAAGSGLDGDPEIVKRAIIKAFRGLDKEIVNTPVELLKEYELSRSSISNSSSSGSGSGSGAAQHGGSTRSLSSLAHSIFPVSPSSSSMDSVSTATKRSAYETMLPALSGSCALLTYVDSARGDIYVACTGDSRAVAGWWDADARRWHVEALSKDQTGRNADEAKRMRSEHPASEADHVIMRGRVLGGLEPTRAFGDARYKWDKSLQDRLYDAFLPPAERASIRGAPRHLLTPPYVTAEPVVSWKRVDAGASKSSRQLKFIVMATDGLWDMMSNEEVVGLVAAHLQGQRGTLSASELQQRCFSSAPAAPSLPASSAPAPTTAAPAPTAPSSQSQEHPLTKAKESLYTFQDDNLSTHLVRNALGGGNRERVAGLLAIPAPESRRYRDDITVNVILFDTAPVKGAAEAAVADRDEAPPKAKL